VANDLENLENLEKSGNFIVPGKVREKSGNFRKKLENCIHTEKVREKSVNFRKKSNLQCVDGLRISTVSKWLSFEFDIVKLLMNYNFFTISDQFIRKL